MCLLSSADFFNNSFRNTIIVSSAWIQIRTDILLVLIWIQTVCKGYQQKIKVTVSKVAIGADEWTDKAATLCFTFEGNQNGRKTSEVHGTVQSLIAHLIVTQL